MPMYGIKEMLHKAQAGRYAVPAFDVSNLEFIRAVIEVAEEERSPVILMVVPPDAEAALPYLVSLAKAASDHVSVPLALHLDHSPSFELCQKAIEAGFTSVMFDGSSLPFDENVAITKRVVEYAHARGVSVEAELGHVGKAETAEGEQADATHLTEPEDVKRFVELTNVDALAVSIGTAHGIYTSLPRLDIPRLKKIKSITSVPLVLHGGSNTPDDQVKEAIANGITKLNIFSELCVAMVEGLQEFLATNKKKAPWPIEIFEKPMTKMREVVRRKIHLCGSSRKI